MPKGVPPRADGRPPAKLDDIDIKLLKYLVADARLSQRALARAIGMSPPSVADRISRLEAAGVIEGYHATLNYSALRRPMTVIIDVQSDRSATQLDLAERLAEVPEVERVDVVTGRSDLQLRLRVRDPAHLNEVLFNSVLRSSEIRRTETYLALLTHEPDAFADRVLESLSRELTTEVPSDQTSTEAK